MKVEIVNQKRRRHAERHHIGEGIKLNAEIARRFGDPRHHSIERVKNSSKQNEPRGQNVVPLGSADDRPESAEHIEDRKQARDHRACDSHSPSPGLFMKYPPV